MQWDGSYDSQLAIVNWSSAHVAGWTSSTSPSGYCLVIHTLLHGTVEAHPDDWVVRGPDGDYWPVKPGIFDATYEPITDPPRTP
jgi:hypothetical protein